MQLRADRSPALRSSVRDSAALFQKALLLFVPRDALKRAPTLHGRKEWTLVKAPPGAPVDCSSIPQPAKTILRLVFVLRHPPGGQDLWNAKLFGQRSPLGLKLSRYVSDGDLQKLTGHTLFRVGYIVIAVRKDAHAHETSGCSRCEVTYRQCVSAGVGLVDHGKN